MNHPVANILLVTLAAASTPLALAQDDDSHAGDHPEMSTGLIRDVRQVTQRFQDVHAATAAGYVSTENCVSGPNQGAMGVHYVNATYIADGTLDVRKPEVL